MKQAQWLAVFLAGDLPLSANNKSITPSKRFSDLLNIRPGMALCKIVTVAKPRAAKGAYDLPQLIVPTSKPAPEDIRQIINVIAEVSGLAPNPSLPRMNWSKKNHVLRRQIRALDDDRIQEKGEAMLGALIAQCLDCDAVEIEALNQGKSGAFIFRIRHKEGAAEKEFVLKLYDTRTGENRDKIEAEIKGYLKARSHFPDEEYDRHMPKLRPPKQTSPSGNDAWEYTVTKGQWHAIHYDFLGGTRFGKFIDLETALLAKSRELIDKTWYTEKREKTSVALDVQKRIKNRAVRLDKTDSAYARETRLYIFETILSWLCQHLYSRSEQSPARGVKLWNFEDGIQDKYAPKPPYSLSRKTREKILSFIESREAELGDHFFDNHWKRVTDNVRDFVELTLKPKKLDRYMPALMAPAHGDLNANNALLWVGESKTFLIDFPFFQEKGHALQDLAQLEVEIEFILMDRQTDSPLNKLAAYDHTYSQMPLWKTLEDRLLSEKNWEAGIGPWPLSGHRENVKLCLEMIQKVRNSAIELKPEWRSNQKEFFDEYFAALLYHTMRAIGYESLSVFKRLLAVYSSGEIIERMR
ncbi:MAG: hypothetical protein ACREA2_14365 [Blastocatellia bacterium]